MNAGVETLLRGRRDRQAYRPLPEAERPRSEAEAYAMQRVLYARLGGPEPPAYKIALTSPVMQAMCSIDHPCAGLVRPDLIVPSPAKLRGGDYMHLGIEGEIAVQFGRTLTARPEPYSPAEVADAVDSCMTAIELVDDRNAAYDGLQALDLVADNGWNAGLVLGEPVLGWRRHDLAKLGGRLLIEGREVGRGAGADVLGSPLIALTWLVNLLSAQERPVPAGTLVTTGSMVKTQWLQVGQTAEFRVDLLGAVRLSVG